MSSTRYSCGQARADEKFREFCKTLGTDIEISWKDTVEF